jgi:hypothetical protein
VRRLAHVSQYSSSYRNMTRFGVMTQAKPACVCVASNPTDSALGRADPPRIVSAKESPPEISSFLHPETATTRLSST